MPERTTYIMTRSLRNALVAFLTAAAIIGLTISNGIWHGLHHTMPFMQSDQTAIAIALSNVVYGTKFGYVGIKQVQDKLTEYWIRMSQDPNDVANLRANHRDAERLNAGIRAAASIPKPTSGFISDGTLITLNGEDIGQVDYAAIAFFLFGLSTQSLYFFYFAIIGLSALIFILMFRDNVYALAVLLCTISAYFVEQQLAVFNDPATPTYFGIQHGATIGLIATWNFAFLLLLKPRPTFWTVMGTLVQLAILILAWRISATSSWTLLFLLIVAFVMAWAGARSTASSEQRQPKRWVWSGQALRGRIYKWVKAIASVADRMLRWPVWLLLIGLVANSFYDRMALHPVYFTDDVMAGQGIWAQAYHGLAVYDKRVLRPSVAPAGEKPGADPDVTWWGAREYMDRIRLSPWDGQYIARPALGLWSEWVGVGARERMIDRMARGAFVEAVKSYPGRVFKIYFVEKPKHIVSTLASAFNSSGKTRWLLSTLIVGGGVGAFLIYLGDQNSRALREVLWLSAGAMLVSVSPNIWAFASPATMVESTLLLVSCFNLIIGIAIAMLWARYASATHKGGC